MAKDIYVEERFPVQCYGRDKKGKKVLKSPVRAVVNVHQHPGDVSTIHCDVICVHNTGGHGQRCRASHPKGVDKVGEGVFCPYSIDLPRETHS